ncbi:hypothetical protein ACO22_05880 [Paracoccidioides brasiliensis]|uniref:Amidase domain-containing protein n=1 Tax=Paracoccidioides brasiliensis TaxID=121759 RepID=A0A1D2J982_PARBR|nr:hypothetical protein ACO22_05880 [Paracoccidioides brasiliensis]
MSPKDFQPKADTPPVNALRDAGSIISEKANIHELAPPVEPVRLLQLAFAIFGTGIDTVNSLRSPASANSLFSIRPTRGLISRHGVIPVSYTQDKPGPIGRSLEDGATALTVMANIGYDPRDNTTALVPKSVVDPETTPVNNAMDAVVSKLRAVGATVVSIGEQIYNSSTISGNLDVQKFTFRELMDLYLQGESLGGSHPSNL